MLDINNMSFLKDLKTLVNFTKVFLVLIPAFSFPL
nr:MAG TPA: hypothetical protein [Caudoviricetes sp.]